MLAMPPLDQEGPATVRSVHDLSGPAGRLEAILNTGRSGAPFSVLLCHPHPLGGGTMHNKVVYHAMKTFHSMGFPVLRFNFRGAGSSEGSHDGGKGEIDDARAARDWLEREMQLPILFAGFSFGSKVGLDAFCGDPGVKGMVLLGLPIRARGREYHYDFLSVCGQPKLFVSGAKDEFGPAAEIEATLAAAAPPSRLVLIENADHFFTGKLPQMQAAIHAWIEELFPTSRSS